MKNRLLPLCAALLIFGCGDSTSSPLGQQGVRVEGEEPKTGKRTHTSTAYLTFVALDDDGKKIQLPLLTPQTDEENIRWREAEQRRKQRLDAREIDRTRSGR